MVIVASASLIVMPYNWLAFTSAIHSKNIVVFVAFQVLLEEQVLEYEPPTHYRVSP